MVKFSSEVVGTINRVFAIFEKTEHYKIRNFFEIFELGQ